MKKIFFSLLAIAAIASCAKTEPTFTEVDSEIKIAPVTAVSTKAVTGAISGTTYPVAENFNVYAYWAKQPAGSEFTADETTQGAYLNNVEFENKNQGTTWGGKTTYYWPKNGSLRFAAYSPATLNVNHVLATDTYSITGYTQSNETDNTIDFLLAPTSKSYTAQTAADQVSVVFEHALSWITLQVQCTDEAADAFTIHSVTIDEVNTKADLTAAMPEKTWSNWALPATYTVFDENKSAAVTPSTAEVTTPKVIDNVANGTVVIPQVPTKVTVNYTQNAKNGTPALPKQSIEASLALDAIGTPWEPGKHYVYTIMFDLDEILITPSIKEDWEEVPAVEVSPDPVVVTTAAQLVDAIAAGKDVTLDADITLDEPIIVEPVATKAGAASVEVEVNLNGNDIVAPLFAESDGTVDPSGNSDSYAFWVKEGGKLTINGNGNVTTQACEYSIAVWAQGGEVVINGGNYENAGEGSDLIYASAGGKVTVNGGSFKANEKQANVDGTAEKYSALNLKDADKATSSIVVYGGSFYRFDPANNKSENPAVSFVATGYNVVKVGDWYTVSAPAAAVALTGDATVNATYQIAGGVLDGAGKTFSLPAGTEKFYTASTLRLINTVGNATIKNVTIDGNNASYEKDSKNYGIRGIFATGEGVVTIDNVTIQNVTYTFNDDSAAKTVNVSNSTLEGWTSYNPGTTANFNNVKFTCGTSQKTFRPHGATVLKNCAFAEEFVILLDLLQHEIVFENCTYAGKPLTAANLTDVKEGAKVTIK